MIKVTDLPTDVQMQLIEVVQVSETDARLLRDFAKVLRYCEEVEINTPHNDPTEEEVLANVTASYTNLREFWIRIINEGGLKAVEAEEEVC